MSVEGNATGTSQSQSQGGQQTPPPSGGGGSQSGVSSSGDWTSTLNDDLKGYVQLKGFKDPGSVLDSYRNMEKLIGVPKERLLKLPEKSDDPAWKEVYGRLGRPDKPEDYKIPVPEGANDSFAKEAAKQFHELGVSKVQAEKMASWWNEKAKAQQEASQQEFEAKMDAEEKALKKEWGAAYDQNKKLAIAAVKEFGVSNEAIDALEKQVGFSQVMKVFQKIGSGLGEDKFVGAGNQPRFGNILSPNAAKNRIAALKSDPEFYRKLTTGDADSRAEWDKLHDWAFGQQVS